jgi:hypothetical protein
VPFLEGSALNTLANLVSLKDLAFSSLFLKDIYAQLYVHAQFVQTTVLVLLLFFSNQFVNCVYMKGHESPLLGILSTRIYISR